MKGKDGSWCSNRLESVDSGLVSQQEHAVAKAVRHAPCGARAAPNAFAAKADVINTSKNEGR